MASPQELDFQNVIGVCNAMWDIPAKASGPPAAILDRWIRPFRGGLKGFLARLMLVDRHFTAMELFLCSAQGTSINPNEWGVEVEHHAGGIFFGMDSSLECFVYALNAVGDAVSPGDFLDVADASALRKVNPKNLLGGTPTDRNNPRPGYTKIFPRTLAAWISDAPLLSSIFEYHDVSKHRSAVATGGGPGEVFLRHEPKTPSIGMSSTSLTLHSLCREYQRFVDAMLPVALEEAATALGLTTHRVR